MPGATFYLFFLSIQIPLYKTDENKINGNLPTQNAIGNETLAAPLYEENPNQLYSQVYILNHPMPISSNLPEPLGNDPKVVYPLGIIPPNFIASTHGNALGTSSTFLNNSFNGNSPKTSVNEKALNNIGNAPVPPYQTVFLWSYKTETQKKTKNPKNKNEKNLFTRYIVLVA